MLKTFLKIGVAVFILLTVIFLIHNKNHKQSAEITARSPEEEAFLAATINITNMRRLRNDWHSWLADNNNQPPSDIVQFATKYSGWPSSDARPVEGFTKTSRVSLSLNYTAAITKFNGHYYATGIVGTPVQAKLWNSADQNSWICMDITKIASQISDPDTLQVSNYKKLFEEMNEAKSINTTVSLSPATPDKIINTANHTGNDMFGCAPLSTAGGRVKQWGDWGTFPKDGEYTIAYLLD